MTRKQQLAYLGVDPNAIYLACASLLLLIFGLILLLTDETLHTTAVDGLYLLTGGNPQLLGMLFLAVSLTVLWMLLTHPSASAVAIALVAQQFLLLMGAGGAIRAIVTGHFADGVIRSRAFIFVDQSLFVLVAIGHIIAMQLYLVRLYDRRRNDGPRDGSDP